MVGGEDRFLILHNDGAVNFTLVEAPVSDPTAFRTLIEHREDVRLDAVDAFERQLVVSYRSEALPRIQLWPIYADGNYGHPEEITFETELTSSGLSGNPNWSAPRAAGGHHVVRRAGARSTTSIWPPASGPCCASSRCSATTVPRSTSSAATGRSRRTVRGSRCRSSTAPACSSPRRRCCTATAPTSRARTRGSRSPGCRCWIAAWRSSIAHVRGGGELGRPWYEHGKLLEKKNTFTDFIAVGAHLVGTDVTRPENLVALGGSAGGLLMGAVANMAPDLFAGILAQVPFVDALTTILDPSLPLTVTEWDEWGNPLADADVYHYMKSYSPYENVEAKQYPAILAMTSLNDTRVYYVEPAKWVAALRHVAGRRPSGAVEDRDDCRPRRNQRTLRALEGSGVPVRVGASHCRPRPPRQRPGRPPLPHSGRLAARSSTSAGWASGPRRRWPGTSPA